MPENALILSLNKSLSEQKSYDLEKQPRIWFSPTQINEAISIYKSGRHQELIQTVMIKAHWRMIFHLNMRMKFGYYLLKPEDLFSIASIAILKSLDLYNLSYISKETNRTNGFSSYAFQSILHHLSSYLATHLGLSRSAYKSTQIYQSAWGNLTLRLERNPSDGEIAEFLGWKELKVKVTRDLSWQAMSRFPGNHVVAWHHLNAMRVIAAPAELPETQEEVDHILNKLKDGLKSSSFFVLHERIFTDRTFEDIGSQLKITSARVREIYLRALRDSRVILNGEERWFND